MKTPEGYEKSDVDKYLKTSGWWWCCPTTFGFGPSGVPDRIVCRPVLVTPEMVGRRFGLFTGLEIKREGKNPTPVQNRRMIAIQAAEGTAFWGTAKKILSELGEV